MTCDFRFQRDRDRQSQYNPDKHHRQSIRLKGYNYARRGSYFITICTQNRQRLFGKIINGAMHLNPLGQMVYQCWHGIPNHFPYVVLDEFVIMPDHMHGIIVITDGDDGVRHGGNRVPAATVTDGGCRVSDVTVSDGGNGVPVATGGVQNFEPLRPPHDERPRQNKYQYIIPRSVGSIIRGFKIGVTKWARQNTGTHSVWQRNYHERIIRDERSLHRIRQYIINNPSKWKS